MIISNRAARRRCESLSRDNYECIFLKWNSGSLIGSVQVRANVPIVAPGLQFACLVIRPLPDRWD